MDYETMNINDNVVIQMTHPDCSVDDITIDMPDKDIDINLKFPNGKVVSIQARPSNADLNYEGSLDFILPDNQAVTCWRDDMVDANAEQMGRPHVRTANQLCCEIPREGQQFHKGVRT